METSEIEWKQVQSDQIMIKSEKNFLHINQMKTEEKSVLLNTVVIKQGNTEIQSKEISDAVKEELRQQKNSRARAYRSNYTIEQKRKSTLRERIRAANLTQEQRRKKVEQQRERRKRWTAEQRQKNSERNRKWRMNWTLKQREKKNANERKYYHNKKQLKSEDDSQKPSEDKSTKNLFVEKSYLTRSEFQAEDDMPLNKIQVITESDYEKSAPLRDLIKQMSEKYMHMELIRKVLKMFNFENVENFDSDLNLYCLIELLITYNVKNNFSDIIFDDIFVYLRDNLNYIHQHKHKIITKQTLQPNYAIQVSCSLKQLQALFYYTPQKYSKYYREDFNRAPTTYHQLRSSYPHKTVNWPYISTRIKFHNFAMERQNDCDNEFQITNLTNDIKTNLFQKISTKLFFNPSDGSETFLIKFITEFFNQLMSFINKKDDDEITSERKAELIEVISEFMEDASLCDDAIETNTLYCMYLTAYPYVRYLGYANKGGVNILMSDQKLIEDHVINVRLQQFSHPKISFALKQFNVLYEETGDGIKFIFDDLFSKQMNTCIAYTCTLCNEDLGSYSPSQKISSHLVNYHGFEPDWECVNCSGPFSTIFLSKNRWRHRCV